VPSSEYKSIEDFLRKMDAGELERNFNDEVSKLSKEQLEELARILTERTNIPGRPSG
jgi:hypothetical protein